LASLHQSLEGGSSINDLGEPGLRTREVTEELLVFVDGLIAFASTLVELAQIIVRKDSKHRKSPSHNLGVFQRAIAPQSCAKLGFSRGIVIGEQMGASFEEEQIGLLEIRNAGRTTQRSLPIPVVYGCGDVSIGLVNFEVAGECAFEVTCRLLELRLEARNIQAREGRRTFRKLLEGSVGDVGFLLIGVDDGQLEVLAVVAEVRFQFEYFPVGESFVIAACFRHLRISSVTELGIQVGWSIDTLYVSACVT